MDDFYPSSGGTARSIETQVGELVRHGHKVTVFAPKHQLQPPTNCEVYVTPSLYFPGTPAHMCSLQFSERLARHISKTHTFDAVHSQTERGALVLAARIANIQNIPHIHTFHSNIAGTHASMPILSLFVTLFYSVVIAPVLARTASTRHTGSITTPPLASDSRMSRIDWRSLARIAARVDYFVTPSSFMMEFIISCLPARYKEHGSIIPTGVNPAFIKALKMSQKEGGVRPVRFLSIGRLAKEKRVDAVIRAFQQANLANAELHIVGSGDQEGKLKKLASKSKAIHFYSHVKGLKDVAHHYQNADVFVLASYGFDNQPITLIEAAAAGLPIVYCDPRLTVGVTAHNSILTQSPTVDAIADAFKMINHSEVREKLAAASRQEETPSLEVMAKAYIRLYRS